MEELLQFSVELGDFYQKLKCLKQEIEYLNKSSIPAKYNSRYNFLIIAVLIGSLAFIGMITYGFITLVPMDLLLCHIPVPLGGVPVPDIPNYPVPLPPTAPGPSSPPIVNSPFLLNLLYV